MTIEERRRVARIPTNVPLDLYDPKGRMITGEGRFVNLSERGGLMVSPKPLKVRQTVRLHVQSAGQSPLQLFGRVVWARKKRPGYAYGIKFDSVAPNLPIHS